MNALKSYNYVDPNQVILKATSKGHQVILICIPAHKGMDGNEEVDIVKKEGANRSGNSEGLSNED